MRLFVLMAVLGLSACATPVSTSGLCAGLTPPVAALRAALTAYADQTPDPVGEAGTDVVLGFEGGCGDG